MSTDHGSPLGCETSRHPHLLYNRFTARMPCPGMLCRVALVRTDVSVKRSTCNIKMTRIGELGMTLAVTSTPRLLVAIRATRRNIPEDGILHSQSHENLKSYTIGSQLAVRLSALHTNHTFTLMKIPGYSSLSEAD
jgi:hypothetical protein